ncbi:unnamed protein product [Ectocarpus sp. 6 AP-2014]
MSGMSLASLGSLSRSRSTKRLGGLFDVDEALDDSRAWRNYFLLQHGPAGLSESGSDVVAELMGKPRAGNPVGAGAEATVAGGARSAEGADAKVEGAGVAAAGGAAGSGGGGGGGATTATVVAEGVGDDIPSPPACVDGRGRVQDLSQRVAELRQQSYSRRLMATAAVGPPRGRAAPPPLPVGVNLAPDETPATSPSEPKLSPGSVAQRVPPSGVVPGAKAAAVDAGYGDSMLEGSGGGGRGVDSSDGGGKGRVKGRRRKAAASFIRKIGLAATGRQHQQHQSEGGSLESSAHSGSNNHVSAGGAAGGGGAEGSLTSGSWSADSSSQGGAGGSAIKRAGLRGRLGQVWSSRRKVDRRDSGSKERAGELMRPQQQEEQGGAGGGSSESSSTCSSMPPAVLQPAGDGGGGFAFLPAAAPLAAPAVAPSSTTAAGNGVIPEVGGGGGGAAPPTSPLGRSFDPNQPLLSGSVDDSNVSLPPQFGTAANSLGASNASFDPNRSTRSWFDTSAESQARVPPEVPPGPWVEPQPQHGALAPLAVGQQTVPPTSRPWSEAERETAAAAAAGIALATSATMSVGSKERGGPLVSISPARQAGGGGGGGVEGAVAAAAALLARPTFDENLLVAELSDLSVSGGGEGNGQDGSSVGGMCLGDATGEQQQGRMWPNCAAGGEGEGALAAAAAAAADWSRPNQQQREAMQGLRWPAAQQRSVPPNGDTAPAHPPIGLAPQSTGARGISAESGIDPMLGQAPTTAPTLQFSGGNTRSQSVDVGVLSHKGLSRDYSGTAAAHAGWGVDGGGGGGDGRLSRAMGSWPHQGADANVVTRSSSSGGGGGTRSLSRSGLIASSGGPLQRSVSVDTSASGVPHGSHRGGGGGGGGREGRTGAQFASLRALQQEAAGTGGFVPQQQQQQQPALDGDDSMHPPALSGGGGALEGVQKSQQQQQQRESWSALHAMIPLPGMGTGAASAASAAATATVAQEQRRRFTLPLPASGGGGGGGGGGHDDDGSSRRPSLPTSTSGVFADGKAALAGGGGSDAGSIDGVDGGRRRWLSGRSWRAALPTFRHSKEPAAAGSDTLDMSVQDNMDEMFLKRRLNSSRSLDLSVGNNKKQCLDGLGPPAAPAGESTAAATATPGTADTSNAAGTTNPTAFEPFDFLRGLGGGGGGGSGASASASSSSTVAGTKPSAGVPIAIAPKGDLPSAAGGGLAGAGGGAAGAPPSPQPPSLGIPQQKQKAEVNPQAKKARQAVAARRPRDRGRFMKSSQKWVTQGELKQTKTTGKPADDGQG